MEGPSKESSSIEPSEGGVGDELSGAEKLCHMKRCAPVVLIDGCCSGLYESTVDMDGFLPASSVIVSGLVSGIKPWQARVGVDGTMAFCFRLFAGRSADPIDSSFLSELCFASLLNR